MLNNNRRHTKTAIVLTFTLLFTLGCSSSQPTTTSDTPDLVDPAPTETTAEAPKQTEEDIYTQGLEQALEDLDLVE
jgi:uncharacterized protein YcfL